MRLLLVDDHAVMRSGLRRLLGGFPDVEILEAATDREALATVRAGQPDLVLLDLGLPDLGGLQLLRRGPLADIARSPGPQGLRRPERLRVHAEDDDAQGGPLQQQAP